MLNTQSGVNISQNSSMFWTGMSQDQWSVLQSAQIEAAFPLMSPKWGEQSLTWQCFLILFWTVLFLHVFWFTASCQQPADAHEGNWPWLSAPTRWLSDGNSMWVHRQLGLPCQHWWWLLQDPKCDMPKSIFKWDSHLWMTCRTGALQCHGNIWCSVGCGCHFEQGWLLKRVQWPSCHCWWCKTSGYHMTQPAHCHQWTTLRRHFGSFWHNLSQTFLKCHIIFSSFLSL